MEHRNTETKKNILTSIGLGIFSFLGAFVSKAMILVVFTWLYQYHIFDLSEGVWWIWVLCFIGDEFSYYWFHRCSHTIRYLWAAHMVHHSSETFNLLATFRNSIFAQFNGSIIFWCWLPILGFPPEMLFFAKSMSAFYQFLLHTETIKKFPAWFEYIFNTPSHHRVHHSSDLEYLDKNHGGWLIIFDRIFNTYRDETFHPKYGLTEPIESFNPFYITFFEWIKIGQDLRRFKGIKNKLNCLFGKPGWMPREANQASLPENKTQTSNNYPFHTYLLEAKPRKKIARLY